MQRVLSLEYESPSFSPYCVHIHIHIDLYIHIHIYAHTFTHTHTYNIIEHILDIFLLAFGLVPTAAMAFHGGFRITVIQTVPRTYTHTHRLIHLNTHTHTHIHTHTHTHSIIDTYSQHMCIGFRACPNGCVHVCFSRFWGWSQRFPLLALVDSESRSFRPYLVHIRILIHYYI